MDFTSISKINAFIKIRVKRLIACMVRFLDKSSVGRFLYGQIIESAMGRTRKVTHQGLDLIFSVPNALCTYRADTFSTKEPGTLEWIDGLRAGSVLWDIGANVGLYSCYAAKRRGCKVFAFEPSVFNLELLARNVFLNELVKKVTIIPLPLSDSLSGSTFNMTTTVWGGALSTFAQVYGCDGNPLRKVFEFRTIGVSMADAVEFLKVPRPHYIKMDVDGIEHLILKGGKSVLVNAEGILIEVNDKFAAQAKDATRYLNEAGFILKEKRHVDDFSTGQFECIFNQIWIKK